jgi:UrcA family protein
VTSKNYKHLCAFPVRFVVMGLALGNSAALVAGELKVADDAIPTVDVVYSGMDLSTSAGATRLYQSLKNAARQVCRGWEGRELSRQARWQRCYDKALAGAVKHVDRPLLTALLQRESPVLTPTTVAAREVKPPG